MEQSEIIEGNKLIAEFINLKRQPTPAGSRYYYNYNYSVKLFFYDNWDWLMPVVEKIIKEYRTDYYNEYDMCQSDLFSVTIGSDGKYSSQGLSKNSLIEATWLAVVEFIKWYNTQKKGVEK